LRVIYTGVGVEDSILPVCDALSQMYSFERFEGTWYLHRHGSRNGDFYSNALLSFETSVARGGVVSDRMG
jgi:hypothetical protein